MTKQRMYNVVRFRDDKGTETQLNATPMTHDEACTFLSKMTKYTWCRDALVEVPCDAQQAQLQTAYTLELATMGRNDVASNEYMDFKRASQAFEDAVRMVEHCNKRWSHVTRIELFNDVSGSLMRWVRKEPALAIHAEPEPQVDEPYAFDEYEPGQWWLEALADPNKYPSADVKRAQGVAVNFAACAFGTVTRLQEDIKNMRVQGDRREAMVSDLQDELDKAKARIADLTTTGDALAKFVAQGADSGDWGSWSAWECRELVTFCAILDEARP